MLVDVSLVPSVAVVLGVETFSSSIDEDPDDGSQMPEDYPKGIRELTIVSLPDHGSLKVGGVDIVPGNPFTLSTLTYTPDVAYLGGRRLYVLGSRLGFSVSAHARCRDREHHGGRQHASRR